MSNVAMGEVVILLRFIPEDFQVLMKQIINEKEACKCRILKDILKRIIKKANHKSFKFKNL